VSEVTAGAHRDVTETEQEQSELDLGMISTGAAAVDEALSPLEALPELPVGDHAAVFEQVLGRLSATMTDGVNTGADDESSPDGSAQR
jgi:hypothetical protein